MSADGAALAAVTGVEEACATARARVEDLVAEIDDLRTCLCSVIAQRDAAAMDARALLHREVMLKRAHGALADAGCVVPIELDRTIEHAIRALKERALTAEERLEQMTRERDEARAQLAELGTKKEKP